MKIRTKLSLQFMVIAFIIIMLSSVSIYFLSVSYRYSDFYSRLHNKANNTATLLIDVEEVTVDLLKRIEKDNPVSLPNERILIYNSTYQLVFSTDDNHLLQISSNLLKQIPEKREIRFKQGKFEVLGFVFNKQNEYYIVIAGATDIYGKKRINNLIKVLVLVNIFSLTLFLVSGWFYAGKALKPITHIIDEVTMISASNLSMRLSEGNGKDELALLSHTFNQMLSNLEEAFNNQKAFISNASHELRTPLTSISGQLDYILMKERSKEEYFDTLLSVYEDVKNLSGLANKLLLLAQASASVASQHLTGVRIDELTWQAAEELINRNPTFKINIELDTKLDDELMTVRGDEQLLKAAIQNVIENGCKYSPNKAVNVTITSVKEWLKISFIDKGIGIPEGELKLIARPFYRGSNTGTIDGSGIGLSLVKRVLELHNGFLSIMSLPNSGTQIEIALPYLQPKTDVH